MNITQPKEDGKAVEDICDSESSSCSSYSSGSPVPCFHSDIHSGDLVTTWQESTSQETTPGWPLLDVHVSSRAKQFDFDELSTASISDDSSTAESYVSGSPVQCFHAKALEQRRIVLLGRTGSGKSVSGNNILGRKVFDYGASGSSVTRKCQRGTAERFGRDIQIIDSPGLFDTGMANADITKEIVKCMLMTAPGPHVFVLVVRIDRFTQEEQDTVKHFMQVFGEGIVDYMLILFTRKDDLIHHNTSLVEYIETVPEDLKNLLQACQNRCVAFNNRGPAPERFQEVNEFLDLIDNILKENGGHSYTNDIFAEAERNMRQLEEQLRRESENIVKDHTEDNNGMKDELEAVPERKRRKIEYVEKAGGDDRNRARHEVNQENPEVLSSMVQFFHLLQGIVREVSEALKCTNPQFDFFE